MGRHQETDEPEPRARANAILLQGIEDPSGAERFAGVLFGTGSDRDGQAIALWCPERAEALEAGRDTLEVVRVR